MAEFQRLGIQRWLSEQCTYMALETPTPIQCKCIPAILAGRHVVGGAATGSGKTAAFALPILQTLAADAYGVFALVLTPSRELAYQIIDQFIAFGAPLRVRTMLAVGGVPTETQVDALKARPHIVAATPGRLRHLLEVFAPEVQKAFAHLRYLVLDEADRLTEGDILRDVQSLLRLLPPTRQRRVLMFTATLHPRLTTLEVPQAAQGLSASGGAAEERAGASLASSHSPALQQPQNGEVDEVAEHFSLLAELGITDASTLEVAVVRGAIQEGLGHAAESGSTGAAGGPTSSATAPTLPGRPTSFHLPETLTQNYLFIPNMVKLPYLVAALRLQGKEQSTIVYVNSCLRAELVRLTLQLLGFPVCSLDSLLTQQHRLDNVASFKLGIARILVCTDIAARGLDIPAVSLVLHYDVPKHAETYVHRVGRTARAGREGTSVALVTEYDVSLVQRIEKKIGTTLTLWKSPAAKESAILSLLDEVSSAKIQARQQVTEQFGARVQTNKEHAARKKVAAAAARAARSSRQRRQQQEQRLPSAEPNATASMADTASPTSLSGLKRARRSVTSAEDAPTQAGVVAKKAKKGAAVRGLAADATASRRSATQQRPAKKSATGESDRSPSRKRVKEAA
ncbi:putative ATP-dependent RNA helicase [Leishmania major strain Friedlin]|uniref:Probable eukaryotic initiation factor 4A n=1 Tax=Leishmania major TaxID=5664 RepID=Q4QJG6_LEIMA|nr:putative ATP-dependent RNA helicase [Leishmania major strain Friedlin]CAG9568215.1 ATP-dependent_RNA_helicase_-_putative [Leishmania major strain Friedlin]CAJ01956.1 putative ATP-dependent RNA helicase [Leishmania major strain Friedlin]|eukprot:XP_001687513.1 putative ATP-dependent RNA helicase [Leishmania major strain Friedlin]